MALRYYPETLLHLRQSPLCTRPDRLPPAEEWMGAATLEQTRTQAKTIGDKSRLGDGLLLDPANRRQQLDRHGLRNNANSDDIVFGPPRTGFPSARGIRGFDGDKNLRDGESHGRFDYRGRNGDGDNRRLNTRPRGDADQDSDGWSTVKPRKSFGAEGAERFHGRMGGNFRDDKRQLRDKDDRDTGRDRLTARASDNAAKDALGEDGRPRNGMNRNKSESWYRNEAGDSLPADNKRERMDRAKSWREKDKDAEALEDRGGQRNNDRRWGRDRDPRGEREPEWFDEPAEPKPEARTQQDFQKWMEEMKKAKSNASASGRSASMATAEGLLDAEKPPVLSAPAVEVGPDKFFAAFGANPTTKATTPGEQTEANKPKAAGKSSRFTSFFANTAQELGRGKTEPNTPLAPLPQTASQGGSNTGQTSGLHSALLAAQGAPEEEKQAFQQLLAKLQKQSMSATPPGPSPFAAPAPAEPPQQGKKTSVRSPEPYQQYGEGKRATPSAQGLPPPKPQEIHSPRPLQQSAHPEQLLQDLVGHHRRVSSQTSQREEANSNVSTRNNSNTAFLMNLMRGPDTQRMPQPQKQGPMSPNGEQESEQGRDSRGLPQQRQSRPMLPPGFGSMEEPFHAGGGGDHDGRPTNQPTQILQRGPPPPGLDQMPPNWMSHGGQMPPPPQRGPMLPPPGLAGGPGRSGPMPPPMFPPPNFPPGGMPPPDALGGPPRNMPPPPPPPGFFNGPPQGFMPPGPGGFNGPPTMDGPPFPGSPFEGRGMPPLGNQGRGGNSYGR